MIFRPIRTQTLEPRLHAIRSGIVNLYLYDAGDCLLAFDVGMSAARTRRGMEKLSLDPARVAHAFLTHSDYDHIGGLALFPDATVYLGALEEPMIDGRKARMPIRYNGPLRAHRSLADGEVVAIGPHRVRAILAPGHTPGSMCYLIDEAILVTGDVLRVSKAGRITPNLAIQNMDHQADRRSVEALRARGILDDARVIATGHTGVFARSRTT